MIIILSRYNCLELVWAVKKRVYIKSRDFAVNGSRLLLSILCDSISSFAYTTLCILVNVSSLV